mgnify:CR=1 FL=1
MASKYIIIADPSGNENIIVFPATMVHKDVAWCLAKSKQACFETVSAGFVDEFLNCYGESSSMGLRSRPEDTNLLRSSLGMNDLEIKYKD